MLTTPLQLTIFIVLVNVQLIYSKKSSYTTPVPILKQIDKHNEDGSYTYGYEAADGTFKIETKYPDGEVYGKYGYIDDTGALREVEYGASRRGFEPAGNEIQVAPPTLKRTNQNALKPLAPDEEDDGQYREDPSIYYQSDSEPQPAPQRPLKYPKYQPAAAAPPLKLPKFHQPKQQPLQDDFELDAFQPSYRPQPRLHTKPIYRPQSSYISKPRPQFRPQPEPEYQIEEDDYSDYEQPARPSYRPQPVVRPQQAHYGFSDNSNSWNNYVPPPPPPPPQQSYSAPAWNNNNNYHAPNPFTLSGAIWNGNPAQNVDLWTGSYSVNYKR